MIKYLGNAFMFLTTSYVGEIHKQMVLGCKWDITPYTREACLICLN